MSDAADRLPTDSVEAETREEPAPPQSQIEWKARIAGTLGKGLAETLQRDKSRVGRLLPGVAVTTPVAKNPFVVSPSAGKGKKVTGFASEIAATVLPLAAPAPLEKTELSAPTTENPSAKTNGGFDESEDGAVVEHAPSEKIPVKPAFDDVAGEEKQTRHREQIEKQRAALKEKEAQITALERAAAQTKRELAAVRAELDAARVARAAADAEVANLRRRAERDAKRIKDAETAAPEPKTQPVPMPRTQSAIPAISAPLQEALRRMLRRGKYAVVAEVCKEAIGSGGIKDAPATVRGAVYALYAAALYGLNEADRAADQDSCAAVAFLDAGAVTEATEAFTRLLTQPTLLRSTLADDATLLRRLVALAERDHKIGEMTTAFSRVRIVSPQGFNLLLSSLNRKVGKRGGEIAATLAATAKEQSSGASGIGADETVILPGTALSAVSPRKLAEAAEGDDARFVLRVRDALAEMRSGAAKHAALADSLLLAVGEISRIAVLPYTTAPGFTPRCAIVDASNVARHNPDPLASDNVSRVASLVTMRDFLFQRGFFPVVLIADATLRFHVDNKAEYLSLIVRGIVRETAPNTSADETLLAEARNRDATLVSNDRFAEWDADAVRRVERFGFALTPTGVALLPQ